MTVTVRTGLAIAAAVASAIALAAPANAAGVKVGVLSCHVDKGWGFVFGSSRDMNCVYHRESGANEHYTGSNSKFGVDVGYVSGGIIVWDVVAAASELKPGVLEGKYGGATAGASVGIGGDVNVLVGGLDKSIALQPISIQGDKGLNVAAGIGAMDLKHVQT